MKNASKFFLKSIAAGWCIGLGGLINLSIPNKYIGAFAFSIGIYLVMIYQLGLITGFVPVNSCAGEYKKLCIYYPICLFGNFIGALLLAFSVRGQSEVIEKATTIILGKTDLLTALLSGIGCGVVIGLIVLNNHKVLRWILAAPLIAIFILTKMEHCVAAVFYMGLAHMYNIPFLLFVILGNLIGGFCIGQIARLK